MLTNREVSARPNTMKIAWIAPAWTWLKRLTLVEPSSMAQAKLATLICLATILLWSDHSGAQETHSGSCSQRLTDLAHRLGFAAELSPKQDQFFARAQGGRIDIECLSNAGQPKIILSYPSEYPSPSFYELIGDATALATESSPDQGRLRALRCHRAAKRALGGYSVRRFEVFRLECQRNLSRSVFTLRPRTGVSGIEHSKK